VIAGGHAFVQNLRRGHYESGIDIPAPLRLAEAFAALALANVRELAGQQDIDGALVGGASLDVDDFARLCAIAAEAA